MALSADEKSASASENVAVKTMMSPSLTIRRSTKNKTSTVVAGRADDSIDTRMVLVRAIFSSE